MTVPILKQTAQMWVWSSRFTHRNDFGNRECTDAAKKHTIGICFCSICACSFQNHFCEYFYFLLLSILWLVILPTIRYPAINEYQHLTRSNKRQKNEQRAKSSMNEDINKDSHLQHPPWAQCQHFWHFFPAWQWCFLGTLWSVVRTGLHDPSSLPLPL